jgi:hypothetical protein
LREEEWEGRPGPKPYRDLDLRLVAQEPLHLRWSSLPHRADRAGTPPSVTVPHGHSEFAEVAIWHRHRPRLTVALDDPTAGRSKIEADPAYGTYIWEVVVGAEEIDPITTYLSFTLGHRSWLTDVQLVSRPEDVEDHRYLSLIHQLGESLDDGST